jgi:hypothetical protein
MTMKKHFLLLLMAFFSLTGFAATDINEVNFSVGNVPYGTAAINPATKFLVTYDITLVKDTHYTWDGKYYSDEACTTEVTLATAPVGTYYVKIEGKDAFNGSKVGSFNVEKATVTVGLLAGLTKVFGAADPALTDDNIDWAHAVGFVAPDTKTVFSGSLTYTYESQNIGGPYALNVTGLTADNYTLKVTGGITITAKPITAAMITAAELSKIYKGAAYTAADVTVTVKDGTTPLVAGTDFEVGLYSDAALTTPATPTDVNTYYLGITEKAGANYSVAGPLAAGTLEITKAGLTVRALAQTKVYNASLALPSSAVGTAFEVLGALGGDDIDGDGEKTTFENVTLSGNTSANAGEYTITPNIDATKQSANYDYNFVPATFTITKRALEIKANDAKKVYGKAETTVTKMDGGAADAIGYAGVTLTPTLAEDEVWVVPADEETAMKAASTTDPVVVKGDLKVVRSGAGTDENKDDYAGALTVTYTATAPVFANYEVTPVAGDFHITGGKIYVTALNQSKNYGEADPDWTAVKDVNFIVSGLSGEDALVTLPTLTRAEGETVKDYTITPSGAVAPAGYEDIVYATATFSIKARPLTIVAKPQTLKVGDSADALDQNAYSITNTKADEGLLSTDNASDVFTLSFADYIADPLGWAFTDDNGISYTEGVKAGNYTIAFVPGELIVIDPDATIVLNRPAKAAYTADPTLDDAATVIAAAATAKFTKATANAYAVANIGGVAAGYPSEIHYTAEQVRANNDALPNAVEAGDDILYTEETAALANAAMVSEGEPVPADYATVTGGDAEGATLTEEEALNYNTELGLPVEAGDDTGADYDEAGAAAYNDALPGAISIDDFVPYTDETAYAKNLTLEGHKTTDDVRPTLVTFGDFAMKAEKWYPIVLPFATSVKEVSEAFGYAIVNILNPTNTDETKIAFKLHMGDIEANQPFVVKVYEDKNMNEVVFGSPLNPYGTGKSIVNGTDLVDEDASGVKFIGSYSHKVGFAANEAFFSVSADKNNYYWGSDKNQTYMAPLGAYFQIPEGSAARTIEFEEADGTVTAIQTVSVKAEAMGAEGWYTVGGVKLNAAPTQKGVYIKDGKKFIVK